MHNSPSLRTNQPRDYISNCTNGVQEALKAAFKELQQGEEDFSAELNRSVDVGITVMDRLIGSIGQEQVNQLKVREIFYADQSTTGLKIPNSDTTIKPGFHQESSDIDRFIHLDCTLDNGNHKSLVLHFRTQFGYRFDGIDRPSISIMSQVSDESYVPTKSDFARYASKYPSRQIGGDVRSNSKFDPVLNVDPDTGIGIDVNHASKLSLFGENSALVDKIPNLEDLAKTPGATKEGIQVVFDMITLPCMPNAGRDGGYGFLPVGKNGIVQKADELCLRNPPYVALFNPFNKQIRLVSLKDGACYKFDSLDEIYSRLENEEEDPNPKINIIGRIQAFRRRLLGS